ncbi:MAG: hypothetical protein JNM74_02380 [Myxococcales bacterium]|nr:hypothetical protein [Myxococcales bacterium]
MANRSNKDLTDEALELGKKLGVVVVTDGLKNEGLAKLVEELRARFAETPEGDAEAEAKARADADAKAKAEAEAKARADADAKAKVPVYKVARGKSVTSRRGILSAGAEVSARDFGGGERSIEDLANAGVIVRS